MWKGNKYIAAIRGSDADNIPSSDSEDELFTPRPGRMYVDSKDTPEEVINPKHEGLMDEIADRHMLTTLLAVDRLFSNMRCALDKDHATSVLTDVGRQEALFINPKVYANTLSNLKSSHIVLVLFDENDQPNDVYIRR